MPGPWCFVHPSRGRGEPPPFPVGRDRILGRLVQADGGATNLAALLDSYFFGTGA
jgi:hypothetical protein